MAVSSGPSPNCRKRNAAGYLVRTFLEIAYKAYESVLWMTGVLRSPKRYKTVRKLTWGRCSLQEGSAGKSFLNQISGSYPRLHSDGQPVKARGHRNDASAVKPDASGPRSKRPRIGINSARLSSAAFAQPEDQHKLVSTTVTLSASAAKLTEAEVRQATAAAWPTPTSNAKSTELLRAAAAMRTPGTVVPATPPLTVFPSALATLAEGYNQTPSKAREQVPVALESPSAGTVRSQPSPACPPMVLEISGGGSANWSEPAPPHQPQQPLRAFAFNSHFFTTLTRNGFGYSGVQRWSQPHRTNTTDCVLTWDLLLFPIHVRSCHWCLAAVWPRRRLLQFFDSLPDQLGTADWAMDMLQLWFQYDAEDKRVDLYSPCSTDAGAGWRRKAADIHIPQQADGSSCGVFVCAFAELLARGVSPHEFRFSQADVPDLRRGMEEQLQGGTLMLNIEEGACVPALCYDRCGHGKGPGHRAPGWGIPLALLRKQRPLQSHTPSHVSTTNTTVSPVNGANPLSTRASRKLRDNGEWLNDELVNSYMELITKRSREAIAAYEAAVATKSRPAGAATHRLAQPPLQSHASA